MGLEIRSATKGYFIEAMGHWRRVKESNKNSDSVLLSI